MHFVRSAVAVISAVPPGAIASPSPRRFRAAIWHEVGTLKLRWLLASTVACLLPRQAFPRFRTMLYRIGGVKIGAHSLFFGSMVMWGPAVCTVGCNCRIHSPLHVELEADVHIGNNVSIGQGAAFVTTNHEIGNPTDRGGPNMPASIRVEDGCWIGARALILPGVTIGRGCVVAAGAVVTADVPPHALVGGVPARIIRHFGDV